MGHSTIKDIGALYKLRLGFFVVMSAVLGWFMGTEFIDVTSTLLLTIGGYLLTGASNGLNQIFEKDIDDQMKRTMNRPLPSGRMTVSQALFWSILAGVIGIGCLYILNAIAALLGLIALVLYAFVYTPLKSKTYLCVFVGAIPGALPPMIGYVAATKGNFGIEPGVLFAVQFMWQFPHFWAIAWLQDEDYSKVGYKMMPYGEGVSDRSAQIILLYTLFCIPASMLPWAMPNGSPMVGTTALVIAILCGLGFTWFAIKLKINKTNEAAKNLMFSSFAYLPIVQITYVLDKI
ncbi:MAG: protoheme IX farnesyltransferase [Crocinitomicaceae bacterium]|nr:protoheme IX farnesyltransferase [Crocinitomicaceae bacterium]|tara:strand:- start:601 stop:1470 length:870 start_codon:yes stop_codon:yes gene_type:complete